MKYIVGVDEVGRGPLAGPVTVCLVACDTRLYAKLKRDKQLPLLGFDSKKLSPTERQKYAKILKSLMSRTVLDIYSGWTAVGLSYTSINVSNKTVDKKGISLCIKLAIERGLKKLKLNPKQTEIRLDGLLKAPEEFKNQKTISNGDEKEKIIAWASILAKVSRDNLMRRMAKKYPQYGFEIHKGYGTAKHIKAIKKYSLSSFHRKSYCSKYIK